MGITIVKICRMVRRVGRMQCVRMVIVLETLEALKRGSVRQRMQPPRVALAQEATSVFAGIVQDLQRGLIL